MARQFNRRYGRLGLQLALAFVLVAVGAVVAANMIASMTVYGDTRQVVVRQEASETHVAALDAAATFPSSGSARRERAVWARSLTPLIALADRSGTSLRVSDAAGRTVRSSPGYAGLAPGPTNRAPVLVHGRRVGLVTLKFNNRGVGAFVRGFETQTWQTRLGAAGIGALFALVVAFFLAPLIAAPVDRLIWAARARGSGLTDARVGRIRGFRDIHQLAATFDEMADNLDQQDRLRRDFVAYITHELRTPIAVLRASSEAMLDDISELKPGQVASLKDETVRLGHMVDDLQRLASAEAAAVQLTLAPHDLADLAANVAGSLTGIFDQAGVHLEQRLEHVHALSDWSRMREVVANLLTNAVKYTPAGGMVVLETESSGSMALLRVSDSGVGIAPEELPHVAERFYRGHAAAEVSGSGIGLAIVDEIVRGHHGMLDIASEPGEGTQVTVGLPSTDASGRRKHSSARWMR